MGLLPFQTYKPSMRSQDNSGPAERRKGSTALSFSAGAYPATSLSDLTGISENGYELVTLSLLTGQNPAQVLQFRFDIFLVVQGLPDFFPEQFSISLPQPVHRNLDGNHRHPEV